MATRPEIRPLTRDDAETADALGAEAFGAPPRALPEPWPHPGTCPWGAFVGSELAAVATVRAFRSWFGGEAVPMAGIAAVAVKGFRPQLRTGIHLGRPRKVGGDYLGVDVNVAARLCEAAKPGEILVSDLTLLKLDPDLVTAKHRRFRAKGAPKDLAAYSLSRATD